MSAGTTESVDGYGLSCHVGRFMSAVDPINRKDGGDGRDVSGDSQCHNKGEGRQGMLTSSSLSSSFCQFMLL